MVALREIPFTGKTYTNSCHAETSSYVDQNNFMLKSKKEYLKTEKKVFTVKFFTFLTVSTLAFLLCTNSFNGGFADIVITFFSPPTFACCLDKKI